MRISAAILAGGHATRFGGRDKSALVVEGRTILERQLAAISQVTKDIVIVGAPTVLPLQPIPPLLPLLSASVRILPDIALGLGPLGGLHTALEDTAADVVLVVACDMPYLSAPFLAYLAGECLEAEAVVPQTERGYHPLCAAYARTCRSAVADQLSAGRLAVKQLLDKLRLRVVLAQDIYRFGNHHRLLANINTPADLDDVLGTFSGDERHAH